MSADASRSPLLTATAFDAGLDRQLRRHLTTLRDQNAGTTLGTMLDDVLAGRRRLRDVARTPEWNIAVARAAERMMRQWSALSTQQRRELVEQGRERLEVERRQARHDEQPG